MFLEDFIFLEDLTEVFGFACFLAGLGFFVVAVFLDLLDLEFCFLPTNMYHSPFRVKLPLHFI